MYDSRGIVTREAPVHRVDSLIVLHQCDDFACPTLQKFVTGLLGVADDMERALESVPADAAQHKDPAALLKGLRDGIALTHRTLEKVSLAKCITHMMQAILDVSCYLILYRALASAAESGDAYTEIMLHSQSESSSKCLGTLSGNAP